VHPNIRTRARHGCFLSLCSRRSPPSGISRSSEVVSENLAAFGCRSWKMPTKLLLPTDGSPLEGILRHAETWPADLTIVGSHGHHVAPGPLSAPLLGPYPKPLPAMWSLFADRSLSRAALRSRPQLSLAHSSLPRCSAMSAWSRALPRVSRILLSPARLSCLCLHSPTLRKGSALP
jgi:hypothetical protein